MSVGFEQGAGNPPAGTQPSGVEIGNIIVEAQRFADETAAEARRAADALVAQAQAEAARIIEQARRQADQSLAQAEQARAQAEQARAQAAATPSGGSPVPAEALAQLTATIDGFSRTNGALVEELSLLRQTLAGPAPQAVRPMAQTAPAHQPVHAPAHQPTPAPGQARPVPQVPVQRAG
jgi:hypothetical protein